MRTLHCRTPRFNPLILRPIRSTTLHKPVTTRLTTTTKQPYAPLATMAVPPKFAAHRMAFGQPTSQSAAVPPTAHSIEIYLDYCVRPHPILLHAYLASARRARGTDTYTQQCPFSGKIFNKLLNIVVPLIRSNPTWASSAQLIFRHQIQPWHPQSTLMHEAALAVNQVAPDKFWAYSKELFAAAQDFFDVNVVNETRNDTYARLAKLAGKVGADEGEVLKRLRIPSEPVDGSYNIGNAVTNDVKTVMKMARLTGVHVSPTVILDGIVASEVSSSWEEKEWKEWLTKSIV